MKKVLVGCAGWSLRKELAEFFPRDGTHLERYAQRFNAVEINSSFYRPHRHSTYVRWAESVPPGFRFAVKMPKQITHLKRLVDADAEVERFRSEISGLGEKLGAVLVQLPPSLAFQQHTAEQFFRHFRATLAAPLACEPRHRSWFEPAAEEFLATSGISRVAADPAVVPAASQPGGDGPIAYFRWHGSPRIYYSSYDDATLRELSARLLEAADTVDVTWCIFDNTAEGEALRNAIQLGQLLRGSGTDVVTCV